MILKNVIILSFNKTSMNIIINRKSLCNDSNHNKIQKQNCTCMG